MTRFAIYRVQTKISHSPNADKNLYMGVHIADFADKEDAIEYGEQHLRGDFHTFVIIDRTGG